MTTSGKGFRSGTRKKLSSGKRSKFTVEPFLREFEDGQRVAIKQDPSSHGGMPHTRYKGRIGVIKGKRGSAYVVSMRIGKKDKEIITKPEHLKVIKQ